MPPASCRSLTRRTRPSDLTAYATRKDFAVAHNPSVQLALCRNEEDCFFGGYPTLAGLNGAYGSTSAAYWLVPQLTDLSEFCGCKDKLTGGALKTCAVIIGQQYGYLKVSELMLFFYRFKTGRYGRFYGSVDPLIIMQALHEFIRERDAAYERRESAEREKQRKAWRDEAVTYSEYRRMRDAGELEGKSPDK